MGPSSPNVALIEALLCFCFFFFGGGGGGLTPTTPKTLNPEPLNLKAKPSTLNPPPP